MGKSQEQRGLPPLPPWEPESQVEVCRCGGVERVESFPKDMMGGDGWRVRIVSICSKGKDTCH